MNKYKNEIKKGLDFITKKVNDNYYKFNNFFPEASTIENIYPKVSNYLPEGGWTTGFYTGILWGMFELTGQPKYEKMAQYHLTSFRERLRKRILVDHHDLGFLFIPTAVAEDHFKPNARAKQTIIWAADILAERYNAKGKCVQAWGELNNPESAKFIIDCNLNVPLLFKASEISKDNKYAEMAINHLTTAVNLLIREDGSTFHSFKIDLETGKPVKGLTVQGYSDSSAWARGQAWAVYGFALAYRKTKNKIFLEAYLKVTDYFVKHLPKNKVPFWDLCFNDGDKQERDSSAAAIFINGVLEMNDILDDAKQTEYLKTAMQMYSSLVNNYLLEDDRSEGLLKEAVYNKNNDFGVNEACIWGDFYFVQVVSRLMGKTLHEIWW